MQLTLPHSPLKKTINWTCQPQQTFYTSFKKKEPRLVKKTNQQLPLTYLYFWDDIFYRWYKYIS